MSVLPSKMSLITSDMLNGIPYAKACIKESMRLFPVTIGVLRTMQKDVSIGEYRIPAGVRFFSILLIFLELKIFISYTPFNSYISYTYIKLNVNVFLINVSKHLSYEIFTNIKHFIM